MQPVLLSVIVPCFNEQEGLRELYQRLNAVCAPYKEAGYEIILVDDGSQDNSWLIIEELQKADAHVRGISFSRNFGHGMALTAGLDYCRGERVLFIDADLQDPPELLPAMMERMDAGADVVYGKRIRRAGETWFKKTTAHFFYRLLNRLSDIRIPTDTGDFRLVNRKIVDALRSMPEAARYIRGMVVWVGFKQVALEYERQERFAGKTHYTLGKMLRLAMDALTGFSNQPLRLAFYLGFFMMILSVILLLYILLSFLWHDTVRGWASLAFLIVGLQSVQWFFLGLIGEYIGRTYEEAKQRPKYIILKKTGE